MRLANVDRAVIRAAVLRDAARVAGARDILLVRVRDLSDARVVEGLVCGDRWESPCRLSLLHEPLLLSAVTSERIVRCCPRRPRRICGPFWSQSAALVAVHAARASLVVVFGGLREQPTVRRARDAAAAVAPLALGDADGVDEVATDGYGVVVVDDVGLAQDGALREEMVALAEVDGGAARAVRTAHDELAVLLPAATASTCDALAQRLRAALRAHGRSPAAGWAVAERGASILGTLTVARSMVLHERRAREDATRR